ncbi:hypothetical protein LINPERHAP2_LOCUS33482 [Linum perenne]
MTTSHGQVCDRRNDTFFCSSTIVAEAKALHEAIFLVAFRQVLTHIFTDNLYLVNIFKNAFSPWPWDCSAFIDSMVQNLAKCPWTEVEFTPCSSNSFAD